MGKAAQLTLGCSQMEWEWMNSGIFLYWHGRLIEAYKKVGGMLHSADVGRGVIGVIDQSVGNGNVWVLNNKHGFPDFERYAMLEEWLGRKADDYWDENFDNLALKRGSTHFIPDNEWVQCDKRRKWRMLSPGFNSNSLPSEWFWCLPPFKGLRSDPEQKLKPGIVTVGAKRSHITSDNDPLYIEVSPSAIIKRKLFSRKNRAPMCTVDHTEAVYGLSLQIPAPKLTYSSAYTSFTHAKLLKNGY
ncbi:hypothetical protein AMTR_s00022p00148920 [Amborella trichopoda]|uniref:Morc S5 domain-containing protein n=1 Tax=Amborella trichopoda TaxID=13333 RepID=W1PV09_AMBTC|nr:hypothetical protein AMTR_s00022p00148920 [Amborella trichopoda]